MKVKNIYKMIVTCIALLILSYLYISISTSNGQIANNNLSYITITGKKPPGSHLEAWVHFWVGGEQCESYSYDLFGQKAHKGGKLSQKVTHDFSDDDSRYEFRLPYQTYTDSDNCIVKLRDFSIQAYNAFDTAGFAQLRFGPAGDNLYNKEINVNSFISAKGCEPYYSKQFDRWTNGFGCYFYIDQKKKSKDQEFNAYTVHYDFSKFNDDTVIHYDILAGDNYRSEPLDTVNGPE